MVQTARERTRDAKAPFSVIPQEIIDAIIDFLGGDTKSLKAAGLVQKSWYHQTRQHLFREITFERRNMGDRSTRLKKLIKNRPTLARAIKHLTLDNPASSDLARVIALTPFLTSLSGFTVDCLDWGLLSDELATSLYGLMSRPRVYKVALINVYNIDIAPLSQFHNLRELVLSEVCPPSKPSFTSLKPRTSLPVLPASNGRLCTLDINFSGKVLKTLVACAESTDGTLDIFHPTTLKVGMMDFEDDLNRVWPTIITRCGPSVENYTVLHDCDVFLPQTLALRHFPRLKCFEMILLYLFFHDGQRTHNPFLILLDELDHLSKSDAPQDLSKIRLGVDFWHFYGDSQDLAIDACMKTFGDDHFWARLDGVLAKPAFSRLKSLIIIFNSREFAKAARDEARAKILSAMPNLCTRPGIVQVME